jgi:hypothetical protein
MAFLLEVDAASPDTGTLEAAEKFFVDMCFSSPDGLVGIVETDLEFEKLKPLSLRAFARRSYRKAVLCHSPATGAQLLAGTG